MDILRVKVNNEWVDIPTLVGPQGESGNDQNAVHFNESQNLTEAQKNTARNNIGAASTGDITTTLANFAGAFVQATAYPAGTYVTYTDGNLYVLPNGHEANATWANTAKTQVTVGGEFSDLKSALNDIGYIDHDPASTSGTWVQGAIDSSNGIIYTGAAARADRIADETFYKTSEIKKVEVGTGFQILCGNYTSASVDGHVNTTSWATLYDNFSENYVRFSVRRTNGNNILPTESTGFVLTYKDVPVNEALNEAVTALMESAEQTNLELSELDLSQRIAPDDYGVASKNQIARLGWNVYSPTTPPEQSIESYKLAYKNGCRIMLCDVRVTQDGRFVLWHDATLNTTVKHMDGTALSASELAMTIAGSTLAELNAFDYGVYKGAEYAGRGIPTLSNFLAWCSLYNCIPMLEIKVELTEAECVYIAKLCKCFGLGDRVIIDEYLSNLVHTVNYWITNLPKSTICIIAGTSINSALTVASTIKNAGMSTLLTLSTAAQLEVIQTDGNIDYQKVQAITGTGTNLTYTEIQSDSELRSFYNRGYLVIFQYIASSYVNVKKWIHDNI